MWLKIKAFLWEMFLDSSFSILLVHTDKELTDRVNKKSKE